MPVRAGLMPSQLERTSAILGEYMLKGWTLTDLHCEICRSTPLMREPPAEARQRGRPNERIQFCALCDGGPHDNTTPTSASAALHAPASGGSSSASLQAARRGSSYQVTDAEQERAGEGDRTPPEAGSAPTIEFISPLDPEPPISRSVSTTTTGPSLAALAAGGAETMRRTASNSSVSSQPPTAPPARPLPAAPSTSEGTETLSHERESTAESSEWGAHSRLSTGASAVRAMMTHSASFPVNLPPRRESDGSLIYPNSQSSALTASTSSADANRRASTIPTTASVPHFHPFSSAYASSSAAGSGSSSTVPAQYAGIPASLPDGVRSERVAQSISSYLERGYSLLADSCTQPSCVGVPLVGYPKRKDGTADGRKMCVSCGGAWVDASKMEGMRMMEDASPVASGSGGASETRAREKGSAQDGGRVTAADVAALGAGRIVDIPRSAYGTSESSRAGAESPRSRMRRELYEIGSVINASVAEAQAESPAPDPSSSSAAPTALLSATKHERPIAQPEDSPSVRAHSAKVSSTILPTPHPPAHTYISDPPLPIGPVDDALDKASAALSHTLSNLSNTLTGCTSSDLVPTAASIARSAQDSNSPFVDIKLHTEAMKDVLSVLEQVGRMERAREMRRRAPGPRGGPILPRQNAEGAAEVGEQ